MSNVYVGKRDVVSYGLFAKRNIKKGEVIFTFRGTIVTGRLPYTMGECWLQIGKNRWIAPSPRNPGRFINHSCNPNAGIKNLADIVAIRNIKKGEEVAYDYAMTDYCFNMGCYCGAENCRKIIKGYKHLSPALKKKYKGYISEWLIKSG